MTQQARCAYRVGHTQLSQCLAERFVLVLEGLRELLAPLNVTRFSAFTYSARAEPIRSGVSLIVLHTVETLKEIQPGSAGPSGRR